MSSPFGRPGVTPADLVAFLRPRLANMLAAMPEEEQEELIGWLVDELKAIIEPAEAGAMIVVGAAAEEKLEAMWRDANEQARRELGR